jgi:membrane protease YdiL (CAAX protease family)
MFFKQMDFDIKDTLGFQMSYQSMGVFAKRLGIAMFLLAFVFMMDPCGLWKNEKYVSGAWDLIQQEGGKATLEDVKFTLFFEYLAIIVHAPIIEEIIYRGVVLPMLETTMSLPEALVTQGIMFGLWHENQTFTMQLASLYLFELSTKGTYFRVLIEEKFGIYESSIDTPREDAATRKMFFEAFFLNMILRTNGGIALGVMKKMTGNLLMPMLAHFLWNVSVMGDECNTVAAMTF